MPDRRVVVATALLILSLVLLQVSASQELRPLTVAETLMEHSTLLTEASTATVRGALLGLVAGSVVGAVSAWSFHLAPCIRAPLSHALLVSYSLPLVGVGPLLATVLQRDAIPTVSAMIGVAFPVFATIRSGLVREPASYTSLLSVYGASRQTGLRLITLPYSLPFLLEAVRLAVPAALLGTLIGEWFGAERGLGVLLASGLRESRHDLVMAVTVIVVLLSVTGYGLVTRCADAVGHRRGLTGAPT